MRELPRDLVLILRTEAKNQRTPPIDYVIAEDGGRMVHRPEPDIAMAELLEEAAAALASERAAHVETRRALDGVIEACNHTEAQALGLAVDLKTTEAALEADLRAAPAAEPVAWPMAWLLTSETTGNVVLWTHDQYRAASEELKRGCKFTPLYTAPPAPVADGWVMVPREPTPEMLDAFIDVALKPRDFSYGLEVSDPRAGYRAMLAAAPTEAGR